MAAYKKRVGQGKGSADAEKKLDAVRRRMSVALTAGKITREQAIERMAAYKKRVGQGKGSADTEEKLDDAIAKRLKAAVKAGKISEEDARARLNRMRKMLDTREPRTREGDPKAVYESAAKKIQTAIAAGEITEAQGKERLEALKKRLFETAEKKEARGERGTAELARQRKRRAEYAAAEKRIKAAIESGKITEAQGKERLAALKEHLFGSSKKEQTQAEHGERRERRERSERKHHR